MKTMVVTITGREKEISEATQICIKKLLYEISDEYPELDISLTTDHSSELISRDLL